MHIEESIHLVLPVDLHYVAVLCFLLVPEVVRVVFDFLLHVVEDAAEAVTNHELDAHG